MSVEGLARRIIEQNAAGRSRSAAAYSLVSDAITTGGEIDVDAIFAEISDDEAGRDEAPEGEGTSQPVDGNAGGTTTGA